MKMKAEQLWTIVQPADDSPVLPDTSGCAEDRGIIVFHSEAAAHAECSHLLC